MMEGSSGRFTALEGGARVAAACGARNTLAVEYAAFISIRLIYEQAHTVRGSLFEGRQRSIHVTRATRVPVVAHELKILTDLAVTQAVNYDDVYDWHAELDTKEVLVCTSSVLKKILEEEILHMATINVLVLDSCHLVWKDENLQYIMKIYKQSEDNGRPRILALTYPLFNSIKKDDTTKSESSTKEYSTKNGDPTKHDDVTTEQPDFVESDGDELSKVVEIADLPKIIEITGKNLPKVRLVRDSKVPKIVEIDDSAIATLESKEIIDNENVVVEKDSMEIQEKTNPDNKQDSIREEEIDDEINNIGEYENFDDFDMYEKLEWKIEELEQALCCQMDLAEDIDGGKRLSATITKPKEIIIEYSKCSSVEQQNADSVHLYEYMRTTAREALIFLRDHRYDPTEIYGEDMYEEFKNIPDPTIEPKHIFHQFLYVLDQLGPYGADKAAFSLLAKLEKLKIKVPYERHFLLLCVCTSVFVKIRCYAEFVFSKYESDWDKIRIFSTPKVLRFAEILEQFKPPDQNDKNTNIKDDNKGTIEAIICNENTQVTNENNLDTNKNSEGTDENNRNINENSQSLIENAINKSPNEHLSNSNDKNNVEDTISKTNKMLEAIEKCDFLSLSNKIEDKVNIIESNLREINLNDDSNENNNTNENKHKIVNENSINDFENRTNDNEDKFIDKGMFPRRSGHRTRGRGRVQRNNAARAQQLQQNPDALCGIVFMKEALMAKIMFMLIVDMSRCCSKLWFLCAQYCAVERPADPANEPRECQRQGKKQEDVLKKFRMHECNLLLATSALEEGIDLPRCNLVIRWDVPASYRSYGLCRGRARASRAACALLSSAASPTTDLLLHNIATYRELDQIITRKCGCGIQEEPPQTEEDHADCFTPFIKPYTPLVNETKEKTSNENSEIRNNENCDNDTKNNINGDIPNKVIETIENVMNDSTITIIENNENLFCNKCNNKRNSADVECPCVNLKIMSINENRNNDFKKNKSDDGIASVDLNSATALINRYCGKLPSDTFTRLAPQWWMEKVKLRDRTAFVCTLRLPLNCPVKYNIVGHPMPTRVLARRMVALQACRILHKSGELDNQLMPIGKENFKAAELETTGNVCDASDATDAARPGTTKRRQYYFKRTAWTFTDCQPVVDTSDSEIETPKPILMDKLEANQTPNVVKNGTKRNMLYAIASRLWCALPERYNTRGRRLHAPQHASQALGILMARNEPDDLQIPAFPVYTRSGEVRVSVEYVPDADVRMTPRRGRLVRRFMRFVFAEVLRVRRRGMKLQSEGSTHNNYYIVPTVRITREDGTSKTDIDWSFLELIYQHTEDKKLSEIERPVLWGDEDEDEGKRHQKQKQKDKDGKVKQMDNPLLKAGDTFVFDADNYREAVVTPWYRNQDQPQFFLVAEICWNLTPDSAFPSATHTSFRNYYSSKYGVVLTQSDQPLLDVDHTSARLNLLTPRYVNRKGVALPVSSERTRRAKRDRLDQKQILVPELCRVHPFAAPLWFATVALPCVLYRINALLIADEIRRAVAIDVGLGIPKIDDVTCPGFKWPPLDFGWSLAEVLSADSEKEKKKDEEDTNRIDDIDANETQEGETEAVMETQEYQMEEKKEKTINDILHEKECNDTGFEIGTWSNDMAASIPQTSEYDAFLEPLPSNLTFCTSASGGTNWCDPIEKPKSQFNPTRNYSMADSDYSYLSSDFDTDDSDLNTDDDDDEDDDEDTDNGGFCCSKNSNAAMGVRIEYKTAHEAEAVDVERKKKSNPAPQPDEVDDANDRGVHETLIKAGDAPKEYIDKFRRAVDEHKTEIMVKSLIKEDQPATGILPEIKEIEKPTDINSVTNQTAKLKLDGNEDKQNRNTAELNTNRKELGNAVELNTNQKLFGTVISLESNKIESTSHAHKQDKPAMEYHNETDINNDSNAICNETEHNCNVSSKSICNVTKSRYETDENKLLADLFPYGCEKINFKNGQICLDSIERNKRILLNELKKNLSEEEVQNLNCFSMVDVDIDSPNYVNEKIVNVGFDKKESYKDRINNWTTTVNEFKPFYLDGKGQGKEFDFDYQPNLEGHPGPSPSVLLQALTMSNANDGINLERLETIGDSFLKFAITAYLYCAHPTVHEGKLSHMRSKQVSNLNLYRLGRNKRLGARMIASKFEPHDNWLPPCHRPPSTLHPRQAGDSQEHSGPPEGPMDSSGCFIPYNLITQHSIPDKSIADCVEALIGAYLLECGPRGALLFMSWLGIRVLPRHLVALAEDHPYVKNVRKQDQSRQKPQPPPSPKRKSEVSDTDSDCTSDDEDDPWKQQKDLVPDHDWSWRGRPVGSLRPYRDEQGQWVQPIFGELKAPPSPLLRYIEDPEGELERMLSGYDALERTLQYRFKDRSLLLQALTHASHQQNRLTDCYQRLEFLGDAILDYLITRHLYEDPRRHSPGALTDLRSALVNNTIFATLAARHGFHKYFRHMSPGLNEVLTKYVKIQEENGHSISEEHYLIQEDEMEQAEDVEVPKALGDLFESVAGAIFLDSGMSLGAVWRSYVNLMGAELEAFSAAAPKSPVRELLEAEPDTAKFGKPERLADGRRVRVCVEVFGRGTFKGVGRNYRIAKGTAARCALRHLRATKQR